VGACTGVGAGGEGGLSSVLNVRFVHTAHADLLPLRSRVFSAGCEPSVHVYNALIAACERGGKYEAALELLRWGSWGV
jgi:hypothetical protein